MTCATARPPTYLPCPLDNKCLTEGVVYNAKVTATMPPPRPTTANPVPLPTTKEGYYTGITINTAKKRITGHNGNINNKEQKGTTLSAHIWELKNKGIPYKLDWSILAIAIEAKILLLDPLYSERRSAD